MSPSVAVKLAVMSVSKVMDLGELRAQIEKDEKLAGTREALLKDPLSNPPEDWSRRLQAPIAGHAQHSSGVSCLPVM